MRVFLTIFVILCMLVSVAGADILETEEIPTSVRAVGMGETFVGIADDSTAIRFNPAGLAQMKHSELSGMFAPGLYGSGLYSSYVSLATPFQRINTLAIDWLYTGFKEEEEFTYGGVPELGYGEHLIYLAFARRFRENLFVGLSLKYYNVNISLDGENWATGQGIGADIGGLYRIFPQLSIGLTVKNVLPLKINYESGNPNTMLKPSVTFGIGYSPIKKLTVGLDINDTLHFGAEYWILNLFAVRAGAMKGLTYESKDNFVINAGGGIRYKFAQIDYAYTHNPDLFDTHRFSATFAWGYHAYLVDVVSANIKDMFASLYKSYAQQDVARIVVKNKTKKPLDATVGIYISGLMKNATGRKVTLPPGIPTEVKLPIVFSEEVMEVRDDLTKSAEVIVSYEYEERKSEDITPAKFVLYNRNAFVWDDLDKITGFVTPQDVKVKEFSRGVLQSIGAGKIRDRFISDNFYKAMAIFDALGSYGMTYITDPNRPFAMTKTASAIDYIAYPAESLAAKSGDCDDCVVLYASCLENVGIPTILIDVPDHIFMMFNSGLTPAEASRELIPDDMYVEIGGYIWIPVETTMYGQGFMAAWKEASESLKEWLVKQSETDKKILRFSYIEEAWKKYPSASVPTKEIEIRIPIKKMKEMIIEDIDKILALKDDRYIVVKETYRRDPKNPKIVNKLGIYYAKNGIYTLAEKYFKESIKYDNKNAEGRSAGRT